MFDIKKQFQWSKLKVGVVITLALCTLLITIFFAGGIEKLLSPRVELKAQIQNVKGLREGAPVWVSGVEVGSVERIKLHPEYGTIVTLSINKKALGYMRKDSEASVMTMGLLGDKYVELSGGTAEAESLKPGDMIKGTAVIELKDVMEASASSITKMSDFINRLDHLVARIERGKGSLKLFLEDPSLYNKLVATTSSLEEISRKIKESSGTFHKLIEDPSLYNRMLSATSSIEEFGIVLKQRQGTLRRLAEDPELYENLNKATQQLSSILQKIETGEGIAGDLIYDKKLASDLKSAIMDLRELTKDMRNNPKKYFKFSLF